MRRFLTGEGFTELLPVMLSAETDPLSHDVSDAKIPYRGSEYHLTKSMILHKQVALSHLDKVFIFSPNIRLETPEKKDSGKHLIEFTQLDLEAREFSREEILDLGEGLVSSSIKSVVEKHKSELSSLERELSIPKKPFERISFRDAEKEYGEEFEHKLSKDIEEPVWLVDIPVEEREFYDREDPERPGILLDMDLIYPEGYGEGISGGEREFKHEKIRERIIRSGQEPDQFSSYLKLAEEGLHPSAGFGIGLERLTRYICGLDHVRDARLFAKVPGETGSL